jgi:hypothetical protein
MARPIGDTDLQFTEDVKANAIAIASRCRNLVYLIDDPDALEIVLFIYQKANRIRTLTVEWETNGGEKLMTTDVNPFDAALNATAETPPIYGEILFDVWFGVLEKGVGKIPYDPNSTPGPAAHRRQSGCCPLVETGLTFAMEREFIAEFPRDGWLQVTLPQPPCTQRHRPAGHQRRVREGRDGQIRVSTFNKPRRRRTRPHGAEAARHLRQPRGVPGGVLRRDRRRACRIPDVPGFDDVNQQLGLPVDRGHRGKPQSPSNGSDGSGPKKTALAFLPAIVRSCRQPDNSIDLEALADKLATTPLLKDHFTATSPEVLEEVEKALSDPAF